ncbi:hypothetical protein Tco_0502478 [Tanacetum coccineum]
MMIALNAKNKLKIIINEYPEPDVNSPMRALWERNNNMIISWVLNTVTDQISNNLSFVHFATALWKELQEHYSQLDGLWDKVDALEALYMRTCNCTCTNGRLNGKRREKEPMPNATKAYAMLRQEEKQREETTPQFTTPTVMCTFSNTRRNTNNSVPNTRQTEMDLSQTPGRVISNQFKPGNSGQNRKTNSKPRVMNTVTGHSVGQETNRVGEAGTSRTKADDAVFAKMNSLHN